MKKREHFLSVATVVMVAIVVVMFASCGSTKKNSSVSITDKKEMKKQLGAVAEVEVEFPCSGLDSDDEYLRVNGNGTSKDKTMAKDRAYQNALSSLATKLAGVASMDNVRVAVSVNADGEEFHDKMVSVSKVVAKANVAGYRTSCEKYTVNPETGAYTCYVAIDFGKEKVVKEMYDGLKNKNLIKADYDFDRYLEMFEKDLKQYEESRQ